MSKIIQPAGTNLVFGGETLRWRAVSLALVSLTVVAMFAMSGCDRPKQYSQATPDDVIKSAVAMVKQGDAQKLGGLIYSDSKEMRGMLTRLGLLLGRMQGLSKAAASKFPDELASMRADAELAAKDGRASSFLSRIMSSSGRGRRSIPAGPSSGPTGQPEGDQARELFNQLFTDPYGWLERNASRLSTIQQGDEQAFILFDGQPAIPVFGLAMKREGEKWYVQLPSGLPGVSRFWPRTRTQWAILTSMVKIIDSAVAEMVTDVDSGRVSKLRQLGDKASEKILFPAAIAFAAYGRELDVSNRLDARVTKFDARRSAWLKSLSDAGRPKPAPEVELALRDIARPVLEQAVRKRQAQNFDEMTEADFETLLLGWVTAAGLNLKLDGDLSAPAAIEAVKTWRAVAKPKR